MKMDILCPTLWSFWQQGVCIFKNTDYFHCMKNWYVLTVIFRAKVCWLLTTIVLTQENFLEVQTFLAKYEILFVLYLSLSLLLEYLLTMVSCVGFHLVVQICSYFYVWHALAPVE